jgi:hypothetical protein
MHIVTTTQAKSLIYTLRRDQEQLPQCIILSENHTLQKYIEGNNNNITAKE